MDPVFRRDRAGVSELLADEFREFGSSGRDWSRKEILELLETESGWTAPCVEDFKTSMLGQDVVLVTYKTYRETPEPGASARVALRSSIWVRRADKWQMLFHQGTIVPKV